MKRRLTIIIEEGLGGLYLSMSSTDEHGDPHPSNFETEAAFSRVQVAMSGFADFLARGAEPAPEPGPPAPAKKATKKAAKSRRRP